MIVHPVGVCVCIDAHDPNMGKLEGTWICCLFTVQFYTFNCTVIITVDQLNLSLFHFPYAVYVYTQRHHFHIASGVNSRSAVKLQSSSDCRFLIMPDGLGYVLGVLSGLGSAGVSSCVCNTFSCCLTLLTYRNVNPCTCCSWVCSINIGLPHHAQYQASSYMLRMSQLQPQAFLKEDLDPCFTSSETTQQAVWIKLPRTYILAALISFLKDFLGSLKVVSFESKAFQ